MAKGLYAGVANTPTVELPEGYTQLEYIESTGTQYIDTGFIPNQDTRVVCDSHSLTTSTTAIFGCRKDTGGNLGFAAYTNGGNINLTYNGSWITGNSYSGDRVVVDFDSPNGICSFEGTQVSIAKATFQPTLSMYLFAFNTGGTASDIGSLTIYSCKIFDNGTLVRNFIPAKNSGGTIGLYDVVNNKFYTNAGSGTFTAGMTVDGKGFAGKVNKMYTGVGNNPTVELPSGYTQVEYIESSGTQYIDTGFTPDQNTSIHMLSEVLSTADATGGAFFLGSANTYKSGGIEWYLWGGKFTSGYYSESTESTTTISVGDVIDIRLDRNVLNVYRNDEIIYNKTHTVSTSASVRTLALFAIPRSDTMYYGTIKVFSCQVYDNDTLVRDYVPCKDSSGTLGLYDCVNDVFYTNDGSGTFTTGKILDGSSIARKVRKAYISVNGIARLFFGGLTLKYKGTATPLYQARYNLAGASVGDYVLFAGGNANKADVSTVDSYNAELTRGTPTALILNRSALASASIENCALFAGGMTNRDSTASYSSAVDSYDTGLTRQSITGGLSVKRSDLAGATIGNYALFAGGARSTTTDSAVVDYINSSLTRGTCASLTTEKGYLTGTTIGNYAIFAGGSFWNTKALARYYCNDVDVYDSSLTKQTITPLSVNRQNLRATTVGNYAIFAGGGNTDSYGSDSKVVEAYDKSLTKTILEPMYLSRYYHSAVTLGDYAIFAFGHTDVYDDTTADVYDSSLTHTTIACTSTPRGSLAGAVIGNYALFAGGSRYSDHDTVDVFELA